VARIGPVRIWPVTPDSRHGPCNALPSEPDLCLAKTANLCLRPQASLSALRCGGPPATTLEPYPIDFNAKLPRHYPWRLAFRLTYIRAVHAQAADGGAASPAIAARRRVSVDLEKVHVHRRHSSRLVGVDHGHRDRVAWIACPRCRGRLQNSRYSVSPNRHAALRSVHQLG
jgi:hypothetical protein